MQSLWSKIGFKWIWDLQEIPLATGRLGFGQCFSGTGILRRDLAQQLAHKTSLKSVSNEWSARLNGETLSFKPLSTKLLDLPYFTNIIPGDWSPHWNFNYYHGWPLGIFLCNASSYKQATAYFSTVALTHRYSAFLQIGSVTKHRYWINKFDPFQKLLSYTGLESEANIT